MQWWWYHRVAPKVRIKLLTGWNRVATHFVLAEIYRCALCSIMTLFTEWGEKKAIYLSSEGNKEGGLRFCRRRSFREELSQHLLLLSPCILASRLRWQLYDQEMQKHRVTATACNGASNNNWEKSMKGKETVIGRKGETGERCQQLTWRTGWTQQRLHRRWPVLSYARRVQNNTHAWLH